MITICTYLNVENGKGVIDYIIDTFACFVSIEGQEEEKEVTINCRIEDVVAIENLLSILV